MNEPAERRYEIHGIAVAVRAPDPGVLDALDLRFRGFRNGAAAGAPDVVFEFEHGALDGAAAGRPVYDTPHGSLHYDSEHDSLAGEFGGVALHCTPGDGVARMRAPAFEGRQLYVATHPLVTVSMMEMLERHRLFSLHAACLADDAGCGVLLAGTSGAGKSTLALALARAGMGFLSDDVVFLAAGDTVTVLGFADAVGLTEYVAHHFDDLRPLVDEPPAAGFPKRLSRIEDLFGAPPLSQCEPRALVFPEIAHEQLSELVPLDPREAMLRLVPDVLLTDAAATQAHLRAIAALLDQVDCYALRSGRDLDRAARLVERLV